MFAAAMVAFALTTTITAMQRVFAMLASAHNLTIAGQVINCELEKIRLQGWDVVSAYPASATLTLDPKFTQNRRIGDRFTLTREVQRVDGNADLLQLTYTISWRSYGRTLTRSFITHYAHYGTYDWLYNT
jgi:hypothetical protein